MPKNYQLKLSAIIVAYKKPEIIDACAHTKRKVYHPITQILYNEIWQKNHSTGGKER